MRTYCWLLVAVFMLLNQSAYGAAMGVNERAAIEKADVRAAELTGNISAMKVKASRYATPWNDYIQKDTRSEYLLERMDKLKNRDYWAVYYYPDREKSGKSSKGGDFCVFVDAHSGEVITELRWK